MEMERFEEHILTPNLEESPEFLDFEEQEETSSESSAPEAISTDDPVRVYLREMGAVRLLSRQGEIDLARRMERGTLRMEKALSRSPLMWQSVLSMFEDVRKGDQKLEDFVEIGGQEEAVRNKARAAAMETFAKFMKAHQQCVAI